jgi:hypothetical protein
MRGWWVGAALIAGLAAGLTGTARAQQPSAGQSSIMSDEGDSVPAAPAAKPPRPRAQKPSRAFEHDPDLDAADQLSPSQIDTSMPGAVPMPNAPGGHGRSHSAARGGDAVMEPGALAHPAHGGKPHVIACSGVFGPDSSHAKVAAAYGRNVAFSQVDSSSGGKVMATVIFPRDPKQRLEVWWSKPANRSDTHLIVINGQSDWVAPGELHLGLTLAQLEQLNGKPFKLTGFDKDHVATLSDWDGGQLSALTGGCKVGISLRPAPKAAAAALGALTSDRAYTSGDSALRAVNPTVSEILIAY